MADSLKTPWTIAFSGSSVHGISQARILKCVAIFFFRGSARLRDQICISCIAESFFTIESPQKTTKIKTNKQTNKKWLGKNLMDSWYAIGFPGCAVVKNLPANAGNAGDAGLILG